MKTKYVLIFLVVSFFPCTIGCNSQEKMIKEKTAQLIGRWYAVKNPYHSMEFFQDYTLQYNGGDFANGLAGAWLLLDDGRVKVELSSLMGGKSMVLGSLNGNRLSMDIDDKEFFKMQDIDYFPLEEGVKKVYILETTINGEKKSQKMTSTVLPQQEIEGISVFPVVSVFLDSGEEHREFYIKSYDGIALAGEQKGTKNPIFYPKGDFIVKYPFVAGLSWDGVELIQPLINGDMVEDKIDWKYESVNDEVKIHNANYKTCLKIMSTRFHRKITFWLAPDVGMVKKSIDIMDGSVQMEFSLLR
ncbi:MAG: hypothetical protein PF482_04780 [Desulfobacteraceae bacterium]|jgi:hypothetical protein|nr:hypothetical protein [Desulfobacteraceae bacterium]